ncbi:MAG: SH3 domain-containing protein [Pseudomonadota bacterium]
MSASSGYRDSLFGISSTMASEFRRMEESRLDWLKHIRPMDSIADTLRAANAFTSSALMSSLSSQSAMHKMYEQWTGAQEQLKRMLDPLAGIHKYYMADESLKKLIDQASKPLVLTEQFADVFKQANLNTSAWDAIGKNTLASINQTQALLAASGVDSHMAQLAKTFNDANKQWAIPKELTESISSLKALQDSIGTLTLPVIDWPSAATLAQLLGKEGIASQLAAMGINADGSLIETDVEALESVGVDKEKGIGLSRKTMELMALISFIAAFLIPYLQELSSNAWQAKTDAELAAHRQLLETQQKTIETLSNLIVSALQKEAIRAEERFVVLERVATVRSKPESGSALVSKLLPQEVVRPIAEEGKWIEVRYYDWLRQDYHTGWVLKKYLKRVSANHRQQRDVQEEQ